LSVFSHGAVLHLGNALAMTETFEQERTKLYEARGQEREARKLPPSFDGPSVPLRPVFPPDFDARTGCRQSPPRRAAAYCSLRFGDIGSVPRIRNAPKAYGGNVNFLAPTAQLTRLPYGHFGMLDEPTLNSPHTE
jgi:hypothetical protein